MSLLRAALALAAALTGWSVVPEKRDAAGPETMPPNIILIYADDVGFGDLSAYGAKALSTPNIDRLAREGLLFRDAHSTSATCTPSRYGLLTGQYPWRRAGTGVAPGNAPMIIEPDRFTLATLLRQAGYATGVVGKWHLGLGGQGGPDWNGEIRPGPLEIGFDYCYLVPATGDRVPCVYVENRRVFGLDPTDPIEVRYDGPIAGAPTGKMSPHLLKMHPSHGHDMTIVNGISRIGYMRGGQAALWVDEDMADVLTDKATAYVRQHQDKPFFLYFSLHDIHVPRVAHGRFAGKSGLGPRGDVILQMDWSVGEILRTLDALNLSRRTLVIFTSDNGPVLDDGYIDQAVELNGAHKPAGIWRGGKYSAFEAATRVPMLVRWPERIKPGVSDALFSQIDFLASFAALTGKSFPRDQAQDSANMLDALLGKSPKGRENLVSQNQTLALRQGDWKMIEPSQGPKVFGYVNIESGLDTVYQLYNLRTDPGETRNLAAKQAKRLEDMKQALEAIKRAK